MIRNDFIKTESYEENDIIINGYEEYEIISVIEMEDNSVKIKKENNHQQQLTSMQINRENIEFGISNNIGLYGYHKPSSVQPVNNVQMGRQFQRSQPPMKMELRREQDGFVFELPPSNMKSHVWEHFQPSIDRTVNRCMLCLKIILKRDCGSTSPMWTHLKICPNISAATCGQCR